MKILHLCLHGKTNESQIPYGIDADTGRQAKYFAELENSLPQKKLGDFDLEFATRDYGGNDHPARFTKIAFGPKRYFPKAMVLDHLDIAAKAIAEKYKLEINAGQLVIHAHYFDSGLIALRLKKNHQVPFLFTPHSSELVHRKLNPKEPETDRSHHELEVLKSSWANVVSSQMEKDLLLIAADKLSISETLVIPPGLELPPINSELPANWDLILEHVQEKKILLMVGRPGKVFLGQMSQLRSLAQTKQIIIGGKSPVKMDANKLFLPYMSPRHLQKIFALCLGQGGIAVNLANYEPFGLFLLEAYLRGLNLVCVEKSGLLEYLPTEHYRSFTPGNLESLDVCLNEALALAKPDMTSASFLSHKDFFNWSRFHQSYLEALTRLLPIPQIF